MVNLKKGLPRRNVGGFTLIELLVAISIIAILTVVSVAGYMTAQKRGRDAKRKGDARSIQQALEQCYTLDGQYPAAITPGSPLVCGTSQTIINLVPYDPKDSGTYTYTGKYSVPAAAPRLKYCLCFLLEKTGSGNAAALGSGGDCTYLNGATSNYQCVNSQQ